jgi:hypothetical protein
VPPVRLLVVTGSIWDQRAQLRGPMTPAIVDAADTFAKVTLKADPIERAVNDLGDAIRNNVRDEIERSIPEAPGEQDHADSAPDEAHQPERSAVSGLPAAP